jgi:hypothetical protein
MTEINFGAPFCKICGNHHVGACIIFGEASEEGEDKDSGELPRAVQNGMSPEEYATWMFLADKKALDEPYTFAIEQTELTKFLRDYTAAQVAAASPAAQRRLCEALKRAVHEHPEWPVDDIVYLLYDETGDLIEAEAAHDN